MAVRDQALFVATMYIKLFGHQKLVRFLNVNKKEAIQIYTVSIMSRVIKDDTIIRHIPCEKSRGVVFSRTPQSCYLSSYRQKKAQQRPQSSKIICASRGSHYHKSCRTICDQDQNGIKQLRFPFVVNQTIKKVLNWAIKHLTKATCKQNDNLQGFPVSNIKQSRHFKDKIK